MKKILLLFLLAFLSFTATRSQVIDKQTALQLVNANKDAIGLSATDISNTIVSSAYQSSGTDMTLVYLQQTHLGIPVYNKMLVLAFRDGKMLSQAGKLFSGLDKIATTSGHSLNETDAVRIAFKEVKLKFPAITISHKTPDGLRSDFGQLPGTYEKVTAQLLWFPVEEEKKTEVKLSWQVIVAPEGTDDAWQITIDANTGKLIDKTNLVIFENFDRHRQGSASLLKAIPPRSVAAFTNKAITQKNETHDRPSLVSTVNYNVIPYPFEAPSFGAAAIRTNPWAAAPGNATTLGWHSNGTTDFTISRGNNVWATEDTLGVNQNTGLPATSSTSPDPLNFVTPPNYNVEPSRDPAMQQFCITNLFYWNNIIHDVYYQYGFDEPAGNFQENNLGRGGLGNDHVMALAQSGAAGHIGNNANFLTPPDGGRGRMRMYLFNAVGNTTLTVNTPPAIAGNYTAIEGAFSTANLLGNVGPVSGQVVYYNDDAAGNTHYACNPPTNSVSGKVALIDRGFGGAVCTATVPFTVKVKNAQNAGAIAVIMVNNVPGAPIVMGGTDNTITIPAVMISQSDGAIFAAQLANNVTVTMSGTVPQPRDGDLDAGIITHEFGHGISNRLTGGPATTSCLNNSEQGGEGWSDYLGLMLTTNWVVATLNDGPNLRPVGTYVLGQPTNGGGIRNYPYTTNITANPLTYQHMGLGAVPPWLFSNGSEVHNIGEIWCAALWEMTWGIIQQQGTINQNLYDFTPATPGGNSIALKLVMEGMKLQPCSPGFLDARNAILTADKNLYGGSHQCAIWTAFAKRGMGYSAIQGSSSSTTDQTAAFDLPPAPNITGQPSDVTVAVGGTANFTVTATAPVNGAFITYKWQVSTNGGATWNDIVPFVTTPTLTLTGVTAGMNGNKYRCILQQGCLTTTSAVATLTVSVPAGFTFNSPAPVVSNCPAPASMTSTNLTATYFGGHTANINLTASGNPGGTTVTFSTNPLTTGSTSTTVTLNNTNTLAPGSYVITVTGTSAGAATQTRDITFTINPGTGPSITAQPADQTLCAGGNTSFSITSATATSFQWQVSIDGGVTYTNVANGAVYGGATTATLTLTGVTAGMNGYRYRCIASTVCGSTTSSAAILTVNSAPTITTQPQNASGCTGGSATFSVTATGGSLTYQWQLSTDGGTTFNNIPGATASSYTQSGLTLAMNGYQYHVIITGLCPPSPITSNNAVLTVVTALAITGQPSDVTTCEGSSASFTVTATGASTYQWQISTDGGATWNNIAGATSATHTIASVTTAMNGNRFRCNITSPCGNATSNVALLTVNALPSITSQPQSATLCAGSNVTFSVTATGTGISYQWQISNNGCSGPWSNIAGATSSSYTINNITAGQNNTGYQCIVTGTCSPAATSNCALLTVVTSVTVTQQPSNQTVCEGSSASFTVAGSGTGIIYQWQLSTDGGATWNNIAGATSATYTIPATTVAMNGNRYRCQLSNATCSTPGTSNAAILTVNSLPAITTQPQSAAVCVGGSNTFSIVASGTAITYQWQLSTDAGATWNNIGGATTNSYTVSGATAAMNGYRYRCIVSGTCTPAATSAAAILTVNTPVTITAQPVSVNICATGNVNFSVTATGTTPGYQWQESTNGGSTWTNITNGGVYSGATTATLTLTGITAGMNSNQYRCIVSGAAPCGSLNSNSATLNVTPQPVITASPLTALLPGQNTTLSVNVTPGPGLTFAWFLNGTLIPGATGNSVTATINSLGVYYVVVTNSAGSCQSQPVTISAAISGRLFVFPSPNDGQFNVSYYNNGGSTQRRIIIADAKGGIVYNKQFTVNGPYTLLNVDLRQHATGIYVVEVFDNNGKKLAEGKVHIR